MADFQLSSSGDLDLSSNDLVVITDANAIRQELQIKYRFFLNEWKFDTRQGVPYLQEILKKNPNEQRVRNILTQVALNTNGVEEVRSYNASLNGTTRLLTVTMQFGYIVGGELVFEPFIVEVQI